MTNKEAHLAAAQAHEEAAIAQESSAEEARRADENEDGEESAEEAEAANSASKRADQFSNETGSDKPPSAFDALEDAQAAAEAPAPGSGRHTGEAELAARRAAASHRRAAAAHRMRAERA